MTPTIPSSSSSTDPPASPPDVGSAGSLRVVANRLPVSWVARNGWERAPGGLVTALGSLLGTRRLDWIGSAASLGNAAEQRPRWEHGTLGVVGVDGDLVYDAVDGMANQVLWPALHGDAARIGWRRQWWEAYCAFNERFARFVAARAGTGDSVWIHDFHLFLVPALLKRHRPDLHVGLSIHTPVDAEQLAALPRIEQIAEGLVGASVIGVQRSCDADDLGAVLDRRRVGAPQILVDPVSIDPSALRTTVRHPAVRALVGRELDRAAGRRLVVSVDRLDYTKGIAERLEAYRLLFERGWWNPEGVQIVQVAQPTRTSIPTYRAVRDRVESLARELDARFRRADGGSVLDLRLGTASQREVMALLAVADVAVVTPCRDGMNLVAKEFSIVNASHGGVLVLGRGAGAVDELGDGSIVVDGSSPPCVANGLRTALSLSREHRHALARRRVAAVDAWTSAEWSTEFLAGLARAAAG